MTGLQITVVVVVGVIAAGVGIALWIGAVIRAADTRAELDELGDANDWYDR